MAWPHIFAVGGAKWKPWRTSAPVCPRRSPALCGSARTALPNCACAPADGRRSSALPAATRCSKPARPGGVSRGGRAHARTQPLRLGRRTQTGLFHLPGGSRVGVCAAYALEDGRIGALTYISALCVRVSREVRGAGKGWRRRCSRKRRPQKAPCSSPAPAWERRRSCATRRGLSQGRPYGGFGRRARRTGRLPRRRAHAGWGRAHGRDGHVPQAPRHRPHGACLRPDVVVTDEVGDREDAAAVLDARRCGAAVLASAHAASVEDAARRPALAEMLSMGAFDSWRASRAVLPHRLAGGVARAREDAAGGAGGAGRGAAGPQSRRRLRAAGARSAAGDG